MKNNKLAKNIKEPQFGSDKKQKVKLKELRPIFGMFRPYTGSTIFCVIMMFMCAGLEVLGPIYAGKLLASFTDGFVAKECLKFALIIMAVGMVSRTIKYFYGVMWEKIVNNVALDLNKKVITQINILQHKCFETTGTATFNARLGEITTLANTPLSIIGYVADMLSQIGFLAYIFTLNIYVALFMIADIVVYIILKLVYFSVRQKMNKTNKRVQEKMGNIKFENIRGMRDIRGLNTTAAVEESIQKNDNYMYSLDQKYFAKRNRIDGAIDFVKYFFEFVFIALCVYLLANGELLLAGFMIAYNFRKQILSFAVSSIFVKQWLDDAALAAQRVNELFDEEKFPTEKFGDVELEKVKGEIEFKNVNFEYVQDMPVLKDVSFKIAPKTIVSFVGESGTGKSTIISLLNRLYTLQDGCGEITLDGTNINTLTRDSLRNNICVVSQSPYVFDMTIAENLRLANPNATEDELYKALKKAELYDFVQTQKDKLNTKLGENGIKLSGGQKQRLAIARALLKDAKVIVFDEATSSLDNITQEKIKDIMRSLAKQHTIIMIAHRLSTVVDSDNIIFIKDGSVLKQGTHTELMQTCPEYNQLYKVEE